jgi:hypothetical protein
LKNAASADFVWSCSAAFWPSAFSCASALFSVAWSTAVEKVLRATWASCTSAFAPFEPTILVSDSANRPMFLL